ncbi:hypothetical protein D3P08_01610 [Paenibacillus nanensis]|uniref:Lipoprotein n=1 Tax=Paenibacillus nanensis TaxID=393251 RepID=A0A3A1VKL4_9BACL|nr:hypothetical protein [Paenibacillus nanensis]RIX60292.1 hypothetical protein D3P08_01610 [Paenibacillus nanensis]
MKCFHVVSILILLLISACSQSNNTTSKKLSEFYPGEIQNVDQVEITNGSSGERKSFKNKENISEWLESIKDVTFRIDQEQEKRDGFRYSVKLFESGENKLSFSTNTINDRQYITDDNFYESIKEFFENGE